MMFDDKNHPRQAPPATETPQPVKPPEEKPEQSAEEDENTGFTYSDWASI